MESKSYKVSDQLYLVQHVINPIGPRTGQQHVDKPLNHVFVIDCSGSMYGDLPLIRKQLKERIPKLLKEKDTLSLVWFSGKLQHGVLLHHEPVATLTDLQEVNNAIDRWLKPTGLTGFVGPLEDVKQLIDRNTDNVKGVNSNPWNLLFMSDGHDNQSVRSQILQVMGSLKGKLAATTIVEYGYYADRNLLAQMAASCGGSHVFSEDFKRYSVAVEAQASKSVSGAPRLAVKIGGDAIGGFAWAADGGELFQFEVKGEEITCFADLPEFWYLNNQPVGPVVQDLGVSAQLAANGQDHFEVAAAYAAVSLFSLRAQPNIVYPLLKALGDVDFIEQFGGCFGKQAYSTFMDRAQEAVFGKGRYVKGWDPDKVPNDDAYTVLDVLRELASDDSNRAMLDHSEFSYNKISRGQTQSSDNTSKFIANKPRRGYEFASLTFNEKRPNVSFMVCREGNVDLGDQRPSHIKQAGVPKKVKSKTYRNYAVVKDGLINVDKLPVSLSMETWKKFGLINGLIEIDVRKPAISVLNLSKLPVVNRRQVQSVSAKELFEKQLELTRTKAAQKVWNALLKEYYPDKAAEGFSKLYGNEAAQWLKDKGITDRSFSAKSTQADAVDFYMGKEMQVSLKGFKTLPKFEDVRKRMAEIKKWKKDKSDDKEPKLTPIMSLMLPAIKKLEGFYNSKVYREAADRKNILRTWIGDQKIASTKRARGLMFDMAIIRFSVIVGQVWFTEFATLEENTMTITDPELGPIECSVDLREVKITI